MDMIALILCSLYISAVPVAQANNLLLNGDFQTGTVTGYWKPVTFDSPPWDRFAVVGGDKTNVWLCDGKIASEGGADNNLGVHGIITPDNMAMKWRWQNTWVSQTISAFPGAQYELSVDVFNSATYNTSNLRMLIRVNFKRADDSLIGATTDVAVYDGLAETPGVWKTISGIAITPAETAKLEYILMAGIPTSGGVTGYIYADNASVKETYLPPDIIAPTPDPMVFSDVPCAIGPTAVWMSAAEAFDASGVEYYFACTSGGGHDSGWQSGRVYTDTGLAPGTAYSYAVKARDLSANLNQTSLSEWASVTTDVLTGTLVNGNFESGLTGQFGSVFIPGWVPISSDGRIHNDTGETIDAKAVKIWDSSTSAYQDIGIIPGRVYLLSGKMTSFSREPLSGRLATIKAKWYNHADMNRCLRLDTVGTYIPVTDPYGVWRTVSVEFTAPADATLLRVVLDMMDTASSTGGAAHFDEFNVVLLPGDVDSEPPVPSPMTFDLKPRTEGSNAVSMSAAEAFDASGVEYYFTCTAGGGHDSGWQRHRDYKDTGLAPVTTYAYTVKARDLSARYNETADSEAFEATTNTSFDVPVSNGDFENGDIGGFGTTVIPGWTTWGLNGDYHSHIGQTLGSKSVSISDSDSGIRQDIFPVVGGHYYMITASVAAFAPETLVDRDAVVKVEWFVNSDMSSVLRTDTIGRLAGGVDAPGGWKILSSMIDSPNNANLIRISATLEDIGQDPAGTANFDNFSIVAVGPVLCDTGDLNNDCVVDLQDVVLLSEGWNSMYVFADLVDLAMHWLDCSMFDETACFQSIGN